jgi:hypothetical protein
VAAVVAVVGQSFDSCSQMTVSHTVVSAHEYCRLLCGMEPSVEVVASFDVAYS